tara:strand:- start:2926 stop:3252 length:327 start_codon:yes stop_codon:yes gene_type:complete
MRLGDKQREFNRCLGLLYIYIYSCGYAVTQGRGRVSEKANAADGGHKNSCHLSGLAQDLNLFLDGVFLTDTTDHEKFGVYWESLHPLARWGGRFNDGNHYSFEHQGVK